MSKWQNFINILNIYYAHKEIPSSKPPSKTRSIMRILGPRDRRRLRRAVEWSRKERRRLVGRLWPERYDLELGCYRVIISKRALLAEADAYGLRKPAQLRNFGSSAEASEIHRELAPNSSSE